MGARSDGRGLVGGVDGLGLVTGVDGLGRGDDGVGLATGDDGLGLAAGDDGAGLVAGLDGSGWVGGLDGAGSVGGLDGSALDRNTLNRFQPISFPERSRTASLNHPAGSVCGPTQKRPFSVVVPVAVSAVAPPGCARTTRVNSAFGWNRLPPM